MTPPTAASAARARAGVAAPAPLRLPPAPRRVSGPSRHPRAAARPTASVRVFQRLIDHPWLERLVRGRAWIAIVATALLGIVAIQVALLRIGAQIGTETGAVNAMIQHNQATQAAIAEIEASHNLTAEASSLGMVYPPPGAVTYLEPNAGDARHAADVMAPPSSAALAAAVAHPASSSILTAASTPAGATTPSTSLTSIASTGATAGAGVASTGPTAGAGVVTAGTTATTPPAGTSATPPASGTATTSTTAAGTNASTTDGSGQSGAGSTATTAAGGTAAATTTAAGGTTAAGSTTGAPAATNPTGP